MNAKKRVLIYTDCYIYGGSERLMLFLLRNSVINKSYDIKLAYRKHDLYEEGILKDYTIQERETFLMPISALSNSTFFYKINSSQLPFLVRSIIKVPFYVLDKMGVYFLYNIISHAITLRKVSPDIIHINNGGYPGAGSCNAMVVAASCLNFKSILYQINNISQKSSGKLSRLYDQFINKKVDNFITASLQAKQELALLREFSAEKIKQLPNTVLNETPTKTRTEILDDLSIKSTDFVLCVVAFLSKRKGQQFLLEALVIIKTSEPDIFSEIKLLLIGDGEDEQILKRFVKENDLSENVFFLGYQSQSINYIDSCDLFVLPSISGEDMPLVVLTAMSKSKRILATDFAGIKEEIEDGVSGILVSPEVETLANDLAINIKKLYFNRDVTLGLEAKKRFDLLFSNSVYGKSMVELYNSLLK